MRIRVEPGDLAALAEGILRMRDSDLGEMGRTPARRSRSASTGRGRPRPTAGPEDVFARSVALRGQRPASAERCCRPSTSSRTPFGTASHSPSRASPLFATPFVARAAIRLGLVDHPAPHKTHVDPTPYSCAVAAGLGVMVVAAGGSIQIATILVAAIAIACLGLVDDARGLQPPVKLAVASPRRSPCT